MFQMYAMWGVRLELKARLAPGVLLRVPYAHRELPVVLALRVPFLHLWVQSRKGTLMAEDLGWEIPYYHSWDTEWAGCRHQLLLV
jgi:hypothetical protein